MTPAPRRIFILKALLKKSIVHVLREPVDRVAQVAVRHKVTPGYLQSFITKMRLVKSLIQTPSKSMQGIQGETKNSDWMYRWKSRSSCWLQTMRTSGCKLGKLK